MPGIIVLNSEGTLPGIEHESDRAALGVCLVVGVLNRMPPSVHKGTYDPRVLYRAFTTLHEIGR